MRHMNRVASGRIELARDESRCQWLFWLPNGLARKDFKVGKGQDATFSCPDTDPRG